MNVPTYTFQSSYPSPVQVGKLDQSSVEKEEVTAKSTESQNETPQNFNVAETSKTAPTFNAENKVDMYV